MRQLANFDGFHDSYRTKHIRHCMYTFCKWKFAEKISLVLRNQNILKRSRQIPPLLLKCFISGWAEILFKSKTKISKWHARMVMHAFRTKTVFFRNSSAKLKVNNTEKRKNNAVKASSTKYFRFVFCINMLVCIINVRENHGHAFHSKDFLKGVFGWCVCVCVVPDLQSVMNQEKKQQIATTIWCCPKCEHIYTQWTNTLSS